MSNYFEHRSMCEECHGDLEKGTHSSTCSQVGKPLCRHCEELKTLLAREKELLKSTLAVSDQRLKKLRKLGRFVWEEVCHGEYGQDTALVNMAKELLKDNWG